MVLFFEKRFYRESAKLIGSFPCTFVAEQKVDKLGNIFH